MNIWTAYLGKARGTSLPAVLGGEESVIAWLVALHTVTCGTAWRRCGEPARMRVRFPSCFTFLTPCLLCCLVIPWLCMIFAPSSLPLLLYVMRSFQDLGLSVLLCCADEALRSGKLQQACLTGGGGAYRACGGAVVRISPATLSACSSTYTNMVADEALRPTIVCEKTTADTFFSLVVLIVGGYIRRGSLFFHRSGC